jgi:Flp pilus assembly protein TadG
MPHPTHPEDRPSLRDARLRRLLRITETRLKRCTAPVRACEEGANPIAPAWRRLWRDRRGVVAILVALALPMMIGFAGLGVETGLWYAMKWQNQSAADAAALSAALELGSSTGCANYSKMAVYAAESDGFTPTSSSFPCPVNGSNCTTGASSICVNNPPRSGSQTCANAPTTCHNAVEVILSQQQDTFLAALYLSSVTIESRSVALWGSGGLACVLALDGRADVAVAVVSGAFVNLTNCWVASNSTSATSISTGGTGTPTCPPSAGTTGLCAYDLWTAGSYRPAGITLSRPPAITYASPVVDAYQPWQAKIRATEPSGSCTQFGLPVTTSAATASGSNVLNFALNADAGVADGMLIFDATNTAVIPSGTTVAAGGVTGTTVTMSANATGAGVASGDRIYFMTPGISLSPGVAYCAPVGLMVGTHTLASGVYYIYGESLQSNLQGIAFYVGNTAVVQDCSVAPRPSACAAGDNGGVTIVVFGGESTQAGSFDINCSFPFKAAFTGAIAGSVLTANSVTGSLGVGDVITGSGVTAGTTITSLGSGTGGAGTYNLSASQTVGSEAMSVGGLTLSPPPNSTATIPAGLLFYQEPRYADTGAGAGHGTASCQNHTSQGPPSAMIVGSGVTLSHASVIYTPATEFDFSGSSSGVCTILDADRVVFGLFRTTSLSYSASSCSQLSPSTTVTASLAE